MARVLLILFFIINTLHGNNANEENKFICKKPESLNFNNNSIYSTLIAKGQNINSSANGFNNLPFQKLCNGLVDSKGASVKVNIAYLSDIEFSTDKSFYTCKYKKSDAIYSCTYPLNIVSKAIQSHSQYKNSYKWKTVEDDQQFFNDINNIVSPDILYLSDMGALSSLLNQKSFNIDLREKADQYGLWLGPQSKTYEGLKLSNLFTGMTLLDDSFIAGVDEATGEVILTQDAEENLGIKDITKKIQEDIIEVKNKREGVVETFVKNPSFFFSNAIDTLVDIFDKKFFGFYTNIFSFLMFFIEWASYIMLGIAVSYFALLKTGKSVFGFGFNENENNTEEKKKVRMRLAGVALAFTLAFFPLPSNINLTMNSDYEEQNSPTTAAKNIFSYIAQYGTDFANNLSDGTYYFYLKYLLSKLDIVDKASVEGSIQTFKQDIIITKADYVFFDRYCAKSYNQNTYSTFNGIKTNKDREYYLRNLSDQWNSSISNSIYDKNLLIDKDVNSAVFVDPILCSKLEKKIGLSLKHISDKKDFFQQLKRSYSDEQLNEKRKHVEDFIDSQLALQSRAGWLNIVSLPLLNTFLQSTAILGTANISDNIDITNEILANTKLNNKVDEYNKLDENWVQSMQNWIVKETNDLFNTDLHENASELREIIVMFSSQTFYLMLPGFEGIYKLINDMLTSIIQGTGLAVLLKVTSALPIPQIMAIGSLAKIGVSFVTVLISLFMSIFIYKMLVKIFLAFLVSLFILVKVGDWITSIIKYFFASPFIIFMKLNIDKDEGSVTVGKFLSRGFIMFMVIPMLIVAVTIMFIVTYEIISIFYSIFVSLVTLMLEKTSYLTSYAEDASHIRGIIISGTIRPLFEVFYDLFMIFIAYNIIIYGDKKILEQIGYRDESTTNVNEVISEIKQKIGKIT